MLGGHSSQPAAPPSESEDKLDQWATGLTETESKSNMAEWLRKVTDISLKPPLLYTCAHTYTACMYTTNTWKKKNYKKVKTKYRIASYLYIELK